MARRYQQMEQSQDQQWSDSCEGGHTDSGGNAGAEANKNNNRPNQEEGGARVRQLEEQYKKKLRQLEFKEKELESE